MVGEGKRGQGRRAGNMALLFKRIFVFSCRFF